MGKKKCNWAQTKRIETKKSPDRLFEKNERRLKVHLPGKKLKKAKRTKNHKEKPSSRRKIGGCKRL